MAESGKKQAGETAAESGRGLGLLSLIVGLAAGAGAYFIADRWIDETASLQSAAMPLAITILQSIVAFSAGWLLLSERRNFLRPILPAALITALLAGPTWFLVTAGRAGASEIETFPFFFWFALGAPLAFYLMLALAKAMLETSVPPKYPALFFHGLTLPLIAGGATLFASLALILMIAWATLLKQMDVGYFSELVRAPWFYAPFLGAIGGLSIAMIRGQQAVLGALRFVLLLFSRIAMPIMALFSVTFLIVLAVKGPGAILGVDVLFGRPSAIILFLALAGMLAFNGVYQNGEGAPPPAWLRLATAVTIATFPVYSGLAFYALYARVGEYGLTPPRIGGLAIIALAFAYSIVAVGGLVTEINFRARKWMPLVAPLNTAMAALWVAALLALSSPMLDPWSMSARSQEQMLLSGDADAAAFDYGYLRFRLGPAGEAALTRIENARDHKQAAQIRDGVARAREALSYWEYKNPTFGDNAPIAEAPSGEDAMQDAVPGPLDLEFNPAVPENDGSGEIDE